jgi:hypothetical protein
MCPVIVGFIATPSWVFWPSPLAALSVFHVSTKKPSKNVLTSDTRCHVVVNIMGMIPIIGYIGHWLLLFINNYVVYRYLLLCFTTCYIAVGCL